MQKTYRVKWYPPLDTVIAPENNVEIASPALLGDFLAAAMRAFPGLERYAHQDPATGEIVGLMVLQGDLLLKRADAVSDAEIIEVLPAIDGG